MRTTIKFLAALIALSLIAACGRSLTSNATNIASDGVYHGELTFMSPKLDDGSAYESYTIDLDAGTKLDVIMQTMDFDAYLQVEDSDGNLLVTDDDSAGGYNARAIAIAPRDGTYTIIANALSAGEYGNYLISVERDLSGSLDGIYTGFLQEVGGKTLSSNEAPTYEVEATAGEVIDIFLASGAFDAYLQLLDSDGAVVAEDDDSAGGTNARLSVPAPEDGVYTVVVKSFTAGDTGQYTLTIRRDEAAEGATVDATSVETLSGSLSATDERLDDDTPYIVHEISATKGEYLELSMNARGFDSYLQVWTADDHVIATDDDSGGGLNAKLAVIVPEDGTYKIIANSFSEDADGDYTITLRRTSIEAQLASGEMILLDGRLTADSDTLADGTPYMAHEIDATEGERLELTMSAAGFDAFLVVFDADGNKLAEDDDSAGGTNSQINMVVPADGSYRIVANSYTEEAVGPYTIAVRR